MAKSEGRDLGYGPPCDSFKARYHALPRIIGCADMPRRADKPLLPILCPSNRPTISWIF